MLEILKEKFESLIDRLELVYVLERIKPAARLMVKQEEYIETKKFLEKYKLYVTRSDFKVVKLDNGPYSNKGEKVPSKDRRKGKYFIYVSRKKDNAEKAKKYESENNHKKLGKALGYPSCCIEFFEKHNKDQEKRFNDYLLKSLSSSKGHVFPFHTNIAARHFDLALLSHFPCSFHCKESKKQAESRLKIAEEYSIQYEAILRKMLKEPIIYTENYGIFMLRDAKLKDSKLTYSGIMATKENKLTSLLRNNNKLKIINKNHIKVGNQEIKTKNMGFMFFV